VEVMGWNCCCFVAVIVAVVVVVAVLPKTVLLKCGSDGELLLLCLVFLGMESGQCN